MPIDANWFSKPGDTISALMVQRGLTPEQLSVVLNSEQTNVEALLAGLEEIDDVLAAKLAETLGGTTDFWAKRQHDYSRNLRKVAASLPENEAKEWLRQFTFKDFCLDDELEAPRAYIDRLQSCLAFFDVTSPSEWQSKYADFITNTDFRTSGTFENKIGALSAWLRKAEIYASSVTCADWNEKGLHNHIARMRSLTKQRSLEFIIPRLRSLCAEAGIALVFVRSPKGCRASGASRLISENKAIIVLSFRHLSDDHFWFTFFHELGHLFLHSDKGTFVDSEEQETDDIEREANDFAAGVLVPAKHRDALQQLRSRKKDIIRFAVKLGISPGIVVGQMQHSGLIGPHQFNFLKRRYHWDQISSAFSQPLN